MNINSSHQECLNLANIFNRYMLNIFINIMFSYPYLLSSVTPVIMPFSGENTFNVLHVIRKPIHEVDSVTSVKADKEMV